MLGGSVNTRHIVEFFRNEVEFKIFAKSSWHKVYKAIVNCPEWLDHIDNFTNMNKHYIQVYKNTEFSEEDRGIIARRKSSIINSGRSATETQAPVPQSRRQQTNCLQLKKRL